MTYISRPDDDDFYEPRRFSGKADIQTGDKLLLQKGREFLIDGLVAEGELVVAWGPPKHGAKTAFWLRATRRLTQGLPVFDQAVRAAHPAVYLATEGGSGLRDRIRALRDIDGPAPDFRVITKPLNLLDRRDLKELIDYTFDKDVLLVVDTLGRLMGASGADENGADMARLIANLDILRDETGMAIVLLHHGTKNGASGPRGHSSLLGAADRGIEHAKRADGSRTATVKFARDDEAGLTLHYGLRPIELPASEFDRTRTAVIAEGRELKRGYTQLALEKLREAVAANGGGRVPIETWRMGFNAALPDLTEANRRQQFRRSRIKLQTDRQAGTDANEAWLA